MKRKEIFLFLLINLLLTSFYLDLWRNANTVSRLLPVKTLVEDGTWRIDRYHEQTIDKALINGHYYSEKAPLPALIVLPFYYAIYNSGFSLLLNGDDFLFLLGAVLLGVIPFLLIVYLLLQSLVSCGMDKYRSMLLSMLLSYSTFVFVYAGTSFSHILSALLLLLSFIFLKEKPNCLVAGFFAGLSFITEYPLGIVFFLWPVLLFIKTKRLSDVFKFGAGASPAVVFQLIYNYIYTGNAFDMLYNHQAIDFYNDPNTFIGFALPIPEAMWKLLFGFYRGLFFHAPVLFLIFYFLIRDVVKKPVLLLTDFLIPFFLTSFLIFSSYRIWYGGWCFGPRHFIPVTVLLLYNYSHYFTFKGSGKWLLFCLCGFGIIYTWMAKSTLLYSINAELKNTLTDVLFPAVANKDFNANNLLTLLFDVNPLVASGLWLMLLVGSIVYCYLKSCRKEGLSLGG